MHHGTQKATNTPLPTVQLRNQNITDTFSYLKATPTQGQNTHHTSPVPMTMLFTHTGEES